MMKLVFWLCAMPVILILAGLTWLGALRFIVLLFTGR